MLPVLEGTIGRRVLLNYRVDTEVARKLVPAPLEVAAHNGYAVAGICLIALEKLRPRGVPSALGFSSQNMAHRIAVRYPTENGLRDGVFIWRRETDNSFVHRFGGRLFPGVHGSANFEIVDDAEGLSMNIRTPRGEVDVSFGARPGAFRRSVLFDNFGEVCGFFRKGDCGFSCGREDETLEGMQLKTLRWEMVPLAITSMRSAFFEDTARFPEGSVVFDCGVVMRDIPHEWHEIAGELRIAEIGVRNG